MPETGLDFAPHQLERMRKKLSDVPSALKHKIQNPELPEAGCVCAATANSAADFRTLDSGFLETAIFSAENGVLDTGFLDTAIFQPETEVLDTGFLGSCYQWAKTLSNSVHIVAVSKNPESRIQTRGVYVSSIRSG